MKKVAVILFCVILAGCAKKGVVKPTEETPPAAASSSVERSMQEPSVRFTDWEKMSGIETVYFDFDKADLTESARNILKKNAQYMKYNTDMVYLVEGNCDERGTVSYNLALGQRRATAVREYYGTLGVPLSSIATISYGSEKPAVSGSSDEAWAKNRRAETKVRSKK